ncbi:hypothetical protein TCAL_01834 [Tigriopus californicus]|uniref:Autophagy-related protein 101 n=1 Tax=Tigriopus californicus TaxID=6832 RepID=A0A553NFP9_TIGCA|nr:autophagy-related protein 101-like [Tigriopus californicus]TRY64282.1 hypothetical protein TCAL_01834 [Tigriopus californicus]|eukprot:TCALIF_01834-PA protein Name:"Similar to atg101 Autophagy-related protein 101 (Xenopus tropicalis)" AED:0.02 eAED:0.02 QI:367/1/1/1/1/1/2/120/217
MNARSQNFEISLEPRQLEEAVLSLFHSVLFHRTVGKFHYTNESSFTIGNLGFEDVDCDFIDHTYLKAQSVGLDRALKQEVAAFSSDLKREGVNSGQVSLEFYQKRPKLFMAADCIPWEVWTLRTELVNFTSEQDRQRWSEKVGEILSEKVRYIAEVMNRNDFVPKMTTQDYLDLIFDTRYPDCQPYLFKVSYTTAGPGHPSSVGHTFRRLIKDTLAI